MFKKILLSFLASVILLQSTITPIFAQQASAWYDTDIRDWYVKVYDQTRSPASEIFGERYTAAQVQWVVYSLITLVMNWVFNPSFTACLLGQWGQTTPTLTVCMTGAAGTWLLQRFQATLNLLGYDVGPSTQRFAESGGVNNFVAMLFEGREDSGINYLKHTFNKVTLIPEAQAQAGFGYNELDALRAFWTASRDTAYGLLIFAAIILAFMIMFRTKIAPQTVISAQSAIPKLIMAIILITFSYAIAGFMIDLVYVVIGLIAAVFTDTTTQLTTAYQIMTAGPGGYGIFGALVLYLFTFPIFFAVSFLGSGGPGFVQALGEGNDVLITIIVLIMFVIIAIVLIVAWIRTLFVLIRALINVYLAVVFAPFYIVFGVVTPALGFGTWMRTLISNLAVFPGVALLYMLSLEFLGAGGSLVKGSFPGDVQNAIDQVYARLGIGSLQTLSTGGGWAPPLLNFGGNTAALMFMFVSLAIITLIPNIANIINGFMSGRPFAYGTGIGEAFGPIRAGGRMAGTTAAATGFNVAEGRASALGRTTPGWVQAGRRILGVRP